VETQDRRSEPRCRSSSLNVSQRGYKTLEKGQTALKHGVGSVQEEDREQAKDGSSGLAEWKTQRMPSGETGGKLTRAASLQKFKDRPFQSVSLHLNIGLS
jgi:hypothetical protein